MWALEEKARREVGLEEFETTEQVPGTTYTLETSVKRISESDPLNEVKAAILWQNGSRNEKIEIATYLKYKGGT